MPSTPLPSFAGQPKSTNLPAYLRYLPTYLLGGLTSLTRRPDGLGVRFGLAPLKLWPALASQCCQAGACWSLAMPSPDRSEMATSNVQMRHATHNDQHAIRNESRLGEPAGRADRAETTRCRSKFDLASSGLSHLIEIPPGRRWSRMRWLANCPGVRVLVSGCGGVSMAQAASRRPVTHHSTLGAELRLSRRSGPAAAI